MVLIEPLGRPEFLITETDRNCLTHVAFCLTVIPYAYWPVKAQIVKGYLDKNGKFHPLLRSHERIFLSRLEFQGLLKQESNGQTGFELELNEAAKLIKKKMSMDRKSNRTGKKKTG